MTAERRPPAQPAYVLRGHTSQVHAVCFAHGNSRLLTGDADGWLICWSLAYKRPTVAWKAHENTLLGLAVWGADRVITHGRDNKLVVWKLGIADESSLDNILPANSTAEGGRKPEVIHALTVNTLNFCPFAWCRDEYCTATAGGNVQSNASDVDIRSDAPGMDINSNAKTSPQILIAVPHSLDSDGIDIYTLPSSKRLSTIPASKALKTGMVMAFSIHSSPTTLQVIAGYESGHTMVFALPPSSTSWQTLYTALPHSQPILSLSASPSSDYYLTSSADAILAKHPLPSSKTTSKPAIKPLKLVQTKHAGQQGLCIRSDAKIFATAGWDSRVRVYSAKTMKELAVLKWHKDGCFATAFADIEGSEGQGVDRNSPDIASPSGNAQELVPAQEDSPVSTDLTTPHPSITTVSQRRDLKAQTTHWLAAGSKDGKVSLWDIF
ncbi:ASTRA complex subunit [Trapelia coarctata]|nr:ASTRA complex subunit [Trapelia coarctata]